MMMMMMSYLWWEGAVMFDELVHWCQVYDVDYTHHIIWLPPPAPVSISSDHLPATNLSSLPLSLCCVHQLCSALVTIKLNTLMLPTSSSQTLAGIIITNYISTRLLDSYQTISSSALTLSSTISEQWADKVVIISRHLSQQSQCLAHGHCSGPTLDAISLMINLSQDVLFWLHLAENWSILATHTRVKTRLRSYDRSSCVSTVCPGARKIFLVRWDVSSVCWLQQLNSSKYFYSSRPVMAGGHDTYWSWSLFLLSVSLFTSPCLLFVSCSESQVTVLLSYSDAVWAGVMLSWETIHLSSHQLSVLSCHSVTVSLVSRDHRYRITHPFLYL